jgi:hypothetical protein
MIVFTHVEKDHALEQGREPRVSIDAKFSRILRALPCYLGRLIEAPTLPQNNRKVASLDLAKISILKRFKNQEGF